MQLGTAGARDSTVGELVVEEEEEEEEEADLGWKSEYPIPLSTMKVE